MSFNETFMGKGENIGLDAAAARYFNSKYYSVVISKAFPSNRAWFGYSKSEKWNCKPAVSRTIGGNRAMHLPT